MLELLLSVYSKCTHHSPIVISESRLCHFGELMGDQAQIMSDDKAIRRNDLSIEWTDCEGMHWKVRGWWWIMAASSLKGFRTRISFNEYCVGTRWLKWRSAIMSERKRWELFPFWKPTKWQFAWLWWLWASSIIVLFFMLSSSSTQSSSLLANLVHTSIWVWWILTEINGLMVVWFDSSSSFGRVVVMRWGWITQFIEPWDPAFNALMLLSIQLISNQNHFQIKTTTCRSSIRNLSQFEDEVSFTNSLPVTS